MCPSVSVSVGQVIGGAEKNKNMFLEYFWLTDGLLVKISLGSSTGIISMPQAKTYTFMGDVGAPGYWLCEMLRW